jgi:tetratricopeptide (TPR) repeat protein
VLLSLFAGGPEAARAYAGGAPIQTDDRLGLEFSGPFALYGPGGRADLRRLRALAAAPPPAVAVALARATASDWRDRGLALLEADAFDPAFDDLARAARMNPRDRRTLDACLRAAASAGRLQEAEALLAELAVDASNVPARLAWAGLEAGRGRFDTARRLALEALQAGGEQPAILEQLASIEADAGDAGRLEQVVRRLEVMAPRSARTPYYAAVVRYLRGDMGAALATAEQAVALAPADARAQNLLGAAAAALGHRDRARRAFEAAIAAAPEDATAYVNLGMLELEENRPEAAARLFREALVLDPGSTTARDGLATAISLLGAERRRLRIAGIQLFGRRRGTPAPLLPIVSSDFPQLRRSPPDGDPIEIAVPGTGVVPGHTR